MLAGRLPASTKFRLRQLRQKVPSRHLRYHACASAKTLKFRPALTTQSSYLKVTEISIQGLMGIVTSRTKPRMDSEHSRTRFISGNRRNIESDRSQPTLWHRDRSAGQMHFIRLPKTSIHGHLHPAETFRQSRRTLGETISRLPRRSPTG